MVRPLLLQSRLKRLQVEQKYEIGKVRIAMEFGKKVQVETPRFEDRARP
jgi:hypothetical protein